MARLASMQYLNGTEVGGADGLAALYSFIWQLRGSDCTIRMGMAAPFPTAAVACNASLANSKVACCSVGAFLGLFAAAAAIAVLTLLRLVWMGLWQTISESSGGQGVKESTLEVNGCSLLPYGVVYGPKTCLRISKKRFIEELP